MQAPHRCFLTKPHPVPLDTVTLKPQVFSAVQRRKSFHKTCLSNAERACFTDIVFVFVRRQSTSVFSSESESSDVPFYFLFTRAVCAMSFAIWSLGLVEKPKTEVLQSCEILRTAKLLSEVVERLSERDIQAERIRLTFVWFLKSHVWTFKLTWTWIIVRCSSELIEGKADHLFAI